MMNRILLFLALSLVSFSASAQLVDVVTGVSKPLGIAVDGTDLYVGLDGSGGKLIKVDLTQPTPIPTDVLTNLGNEWSGGLFVKGDTVYAGNFNTGTIIKFDKTQASPTIVPVVSGLGILWNVIPVGDFIYIAGSVGITKYDLTGDSIVTTYIAPDAYGLEWKDSVIYYTEANFLSFKTSIYRIDEKVASPISELLFSGINNPSGLTINGNFLYVAADAIIGKIDLGQSPAQLDTVVSGINKGALTAFDGLDMFISEYFGNKISKLTIGTPEFGVQPKVCITSTPGTLGGATPTGGTYSGTGVTDNGDGTTFSFDPAVAGGVGTYIITYTVTNGQTASTTLEVVGVPTVTLTAFSDVIIDAGLQALTGGMPAGGTYSGPGVIGTDFDPTVAGLGTHDITYTYTDGNGCIASATESITVNPVVPADNDCAGANDLTSLLGGTVNVAQTSSLYDNRAYNSTGDPATGWDCFGEPDGTGTGPTLDKTMWFKFTGDGNVYRIKTVKCTAPDIIYGGDTQMALYTGDCGNLTPLSCNEDEGGVNQLVNSILEVGTQPGIEYRLMVDGFGGAFPDFGQYCLEVTSLGANTITNIALTNIEISPNPTTGWVDIRNVTPDMVQVYDATGKLVQVDQQPGNRINISQLPVGIYSLNILKGDAIYSTRVVKQ